MKPTTSALLLAILFLLSVRGAAQDKPPSVTTLTRRVLVLNLDPVIEVENGKRLNEVMRWHDPRLLNQAYLDALSEASGGIVQWQVTDWHDLDLWPVKKDGFQYTDEAYLQSAHDSESYPWHQPDGIDYDALIDLRLPDGNTPHGLAADRHVDEIICWAFPYSGFYESRMVGSTAYWCNSEPLIRDSRLYVVMGMNPERGVAEALHSFGHRSESILTKVYGSWSDGPVKHNWDRFTRVASKHAGVTAGVGNIHFPPNASADYAYDVESAVESEADLWLTFPKLDGSPKPITRDSWGGPDFHLNYMKWWFTRLPNAPGRWDESDNAANHGKLNNWWPYLVDMNEHEESRQ
jgi:hypothetical protein